MTLKICKCLDHNYRYGVKIIYHFIHFNLKGDGHTIFTFMRCLDCSGCFGYPPRNFEIALEKGTIEAIEELVLIYHSALVT